MPAEPAVDDRARLDDELAGLDALEQTAAPRRARPLVVWSATWPKLTAAAVGLGLWQLVVWSGWKPEYILPGPDKVLPELKDMAADGTLWKVVQTTMSRAAIGTKAIPRASQPTMKATPPTGVIAPAQRGAPSASP